MANRIIDSVSRAISQQLYDCLSSIFISELMNPSSELYLISGWITNLNVLSNSYGQIRAFLPETQIREISLAQYFEILADRGTSIYLLLRDEPHNQKFYSVLNTTHENIQVKFGADIHKKVIVCDHFYVRGSMNFTWTGMNKNDENLEFTTNRATISQAMLNAAQSWKAVSDDGFDE